MSMALAALSLFSAGLPGIYDFPRPYFHWSHVAPWWVRVGKRNPRRSRR